MILTFPSPTSSSAQSSMGASSAASPYAASFTLESGVASAVVAPVLGSSRSAWDSVGGVGVSVGLRLFGLFFSLPRVKKVKN
jgi:hypothetical protein